MSYAYKYKRDQISTREKILLLITLVAVVFSASVVFTNKPAVYSGEITEIERASITDLSTEGFVAVRPVADVVEGRGVISLTGNCYRVTAGTEPGQAESIRDAIEGVVGPRPNTHELMRDVFKNLNIEVIMAKVTELRGGNFLGKLILKQGDILLSMDSKPSDGIAIALRTNTPIYFNETLLKERGQKVC